MTRHTLLGRVHWQNVESLVKLQVVANRVTIVFHVYCTLGSDRSNDWVLCLNAWPAAWWPLIGLLNPLLAGMHWKHWEHPGHWKPHWKHSPKDYGQFGRFGNWALWRDPSLLRDKCSRSHEWCGNVDSIACLTLIISEFEWDNQCYKVN